jgi:hypothetical protein
LFGYAFVHPKGHPLLPGWPDWANFRSLNRCWLWAFLQIRPNFQANFSHGDSYVYIWTKEKFGYSLVDFFTHLVTLIYPLGNVFPSYCQSKLQFEMKMFPKFSRQSFFKTKETFYSINHNLHRKMHNIKQSMYVYLSMPCCRSNSKNPSH